MRSGNKAMEWFDIKRGGLALLLAAGMTGVCSGKNSAPAKDGAVNAKTTGVAVARDPFWPVGFEPEKPADIKAVKQQSLADKNWNEAMSQVAIQGVSTSSGEYYAIINAEMKRVGESVSVQLGGVRYTWKVDHIAPPGSVKLRRVSAE